MREAAMEAGLLERLTPARFAWICRGPVLLAAAIIIGLMAFNTGRLLLAPAPRNAWEALEVVEGYRSVQGMPVYELGPSAHATHMYGALVPWVQGRLFRTLGPNNISGRLMTLLSGLGVVALIVIVCRRDRLDWLLPIAVAIVLGVDHRGGHYFAENRPDMSALLCSALAIVLLYLGVERTRLAAVIAGTLLLVLGFFFKQISFVFAAVPAVALVLRGRWPRWREILLAAIPLATAFVVPTVLRLGWPAVYHYMLELPGSYLVRWDRVPKYCWEFLVDSPLFLLLLGEWIARDFGRDRGADPRVRWLLAIFAVMLPWSAIAHSKVGGWPNSLLPALFAMVGFCVLRLPRLGAWIDAPARPRVARLAAAALVALLMLTTAFPRINRASGIVTPRSPFDADYKGAVTLAKSLPGKVVCPEDPTIALYAKGYVGYNASAEKDGCPERGVYTERRLELVRSEVESADYVIDLDDDFCPYINPERLRALGFEQVETPRLTSGQYRFWKRVRASSGDIAARIP